MGTEGDEFVEEKGLGDQGWGGWRCGRLDGDQAEVIDEAFEGAEGVTTVDVLLQGSKPGLDG